jgi:hypothetical protein
MDEFESVPPIAETVEVSEADLLRVLAREPGNREALVLLARLDREELCELLFIPALWDDAAALAGTWERIVAATPEEPSARNWIAERMVRLAGEFFNARAFGRARRVFRCVYEEWLTDPEARRQVIEAEPLIVLFGEAADLVEDENISDSLRRYAYCRYIDEGHAVSDETRAAVARAVCEDAERDPMLTRDLFAYVAHRYPRIMQDNPELLTAVGQGG